jgi:bacterioferritin-associated ferredoxin
MKPVFIFAEQIQSIVRSGEKEIEIPEGARISSAAADLIKENKILIKTVAPGKVTVTPGEKDATEAKSAGTEKKATHQEQSPSPVKKSKRNALPENSAEISEAELEEIVSHVLNRFKALKGDDNLITASQSPVQAPKETNSATDSDDLVICRCEEITRGEIKDVIRNGIQTLNGVKRVTRAGMGLCQGQTCQQLVARILTEELGLSTADIDPTTARGPVRPLRLGVFANS